MLHAPYWMVAPLRWLTSANILAISCLLMRMTTLTYILNQNRLLYAGTNLLMRKFSQCSKDVKLSLFMSFCMNFYGDCLWNRYNVTVIKRFEAAYIKCVRMFFGYHKYHSATSMLLDLGLPTVSTILHNTRMRLGLCVESHKNELVKVMRDICK
jgi:hypothetical protein